MNIPWLTIVLLLPLGASILLQVIPRTATTLLKAFTVAATLATAIVVFVLVATMVVVLAIRASERFVYYETKGE